MTSTEQQDIINEEVSTPQASTLITHSKLQNQHLQRSQTPRIPKKMAAGKATAEKTRLAREAQEIALEAIIRAGSAEKEKLAELKNKSGNILPPIPEEREDPEPTPQPTEPQRRSSFSLWVAVAGVAVAGVGVAVTLVTYLFKREKVKAFLGLTTTRQQAPQ